MRGEVKIVNIVNIANIASPAHLLCKSLILFYHEASLRREQRLRDGEDWGDILCFSGLFGVFIHICCSIFRVNLLLWQITIWKGWAAMPMVVWWVTDLSRGPQPPPATAGPDPAKPGPTRQLSGHLHYKRGPGSTTPAAGRTLLLWPPRPIITVIGVHIHNLILAFLRHGICQKWLR